MSLLSDLENLTANYSTPNTYQNLIRFNRNKYNWNKYIKENNPSYNDVIESNNLGLFNKLLNQKTPELHDLEVIIKNDNLKFLRLILKRYPHLATFELFIFAVEYKSIKSLKFLILGYEINQEQYFELLSLVVEYNDLAMLRLLHKIIPLTFEETEPLINLAKIYKYKDIVKYLSKVESEI